MAACCPPAWQDDGQLAAALDALGDKLAAAAAAQTRFARRALGVAAGGCAVVTNGRVVELPAGEGGEGGDGARGWNRSGNRGASR